MPAAAPLQGDLPAGDPGERSHLPLPGFVLGLGVSVALWLGLGVSVWLMLARRF
jgi:hypothetical protein